jgi:hypothetical protein
MPLFTTICSSKEVGQVGNQTALQEDEEGAIENVPGDHSYDRHSFLTILDNVFTVGGRLGAKSEMTGLSINQEAFQKEPGVRKMVRRRTSLRRFSGSMSTTKNKFTLLGPTLKKNFKKHASI